MNKKIWTLLKIIVTITAIYFLVYKTGFENIINAIKTISIPFLIIAALIHLVYLTVGAENIRAFIQAISKKISFKKSWEYYAKSWAWGMIIPGKMGDLSLIYYLKKEKIGYSQGLAVSVLVKIASFFVLGLFSAIGLFMFVKQPYSYLILIAYFFGLAVTIILLMSKKFFTMLGNVFKKYSKQIESFGKSVKMGLQHKKYFFSGLGLTILRWIVDGCTNYAIFLGFGISIPFYYVVIISALSSLIAMIPITISGLGIREGTKTYFYSLVGVPVGIAAGVAVIYIILLYLFTAVFLIFGKTKTNNSKVINKN